jgi:N-acetylglucosamine malate deacetylase 1
MRTLKETFRRVIAYGPHTDDIELGCGGTICRLQEEGVNIFCVNFSICEDWVPEPFPKDILKKEAFLAAKTMGLLEENIEIHRFQATELWKVRDKIFSIMESHRNKISPDLILVPSRRDLHQDHSAVANEASRVFKWTNIISYETPWNNLDFGKNVYMQFEEKHLDRKLKALDCYDSQKVKSYVDESFIRSLAKVRGMEVGSEYAECFELIRMVF